MILPAKLVNERLMFLIDYGDKLPWGSVITRAKITVTVSSGEDTTPQKVFSQVWDIDGTIVTYQVRNGLPGVVYDLNTAVQVSGEWLYMTVKLAVLPDSGDVGALYPLTRVFTSLPYVQLIVEETTQTVFPTDGLLIRLLYDSVVQPDNVNQSLIPTNGDLFEVPPPEFVDAINQNLIPSNGDLKDPPLSELQDDNVEPTLIPTGGQLKIPPLGNVFDQVNQGVLPTGGDLYSLIDLTAWRTSNIGPGLTFTNSYKTVERLALGNDAYTNSTASANTHSTGKWYAEVAINHDGEWSGFGGLVLSSQNMINITDNGYGGINNGVACNTRAGAGWTPWVIRNAGTGVPLGGPQGGQGAIIGVAVDCDTGKCWLRLNGENSWVSGSNTIGVFDIDDPTYTFTPNSDMAVFGHSPFSNTAVTLNTGPTFVFSKPSGFSDWTP